MYDCTLFDTDLKWYKTLQFHRLLSIFLVDEKENMRRRKNPLSLGGKRGTYINAQKSRKDNWETSRWQLDGKYQNISVSFLKPDHRIMITESQNRRITEP